jgi:uncharacterized protein
MARAEVLIISGSGGYADEWHDLPATSARVAAIVEGLGHSVRLAGDVEPALADPGHVPLLVLNLGRPAGPRPATTAAAARDGLMAHLAAGGAVLALHSTIIALSVVPELSDIVGGAWIDGRSMHPPRGEATLERVSGVEHPIAARPNLRVLDERYSYLEVEPDCTVLYDHEHDDRRHPVVWTRTIGPGRIVYDALGHDPASYESPDHEDLVRRSVGWLLGER